MALPEQRASDAEREAAAERIRVAAGDGRLDADELEERLERAYAARTVGDLEALTRDLPEPGGARGERESVWSSEHVREKLAGFIVVRSEEHTSELQSRQYLVCRLLLDK